MIKNDTAKDFAYLTSQEYNRLYGGALIDDETVCFINDKGTIYTHNHEFGAGKSYSAGDYIKITNNAIGVNFNELTAALRNAGFGTGSGSSSGSGVTYTAGTGIEINSNNKISVDQLWLNTYVSGKINNTDISLATDSKIGGFKTGYPENTDKTYKVQLDSQGRAFVRVPWSSTIVNPEDPNSQYYDELQERINTLQTLINNLQEDLNSIHQTSEDEIKQMIKNILIEANWLKENFPIDEIFHLSDYYDDINGYLQLVGLIKEDGSVGWSSLIQTINDITARVQAILESIGDNGEINLEALLASLLAYVDNKIAGLNLTAKYAVQDENQQVIEWMTSGFKALAGKTEGEDGYKVNFAQMYSDAFDGVNSATAAMRTEILYDYDGKIEAAKAWMGTLMDNRLAGVITQSNKDSAIATLFAENSETDTKAAVMATVKNDESFLDLIADRVTIDADTTVIQGYLEAGNATFRGTVRADNLYRNIQFCRLSVTDQWTSTISYSKPMYQYTENLSDPDPIPEFVNGGLYTLDQINSVVNSGGLTPDGDTISNWYEYNNEKFHRCIGNSDIVDLISNTDRNLNLGNDEVIVFPDPEFHQGKMIELYSTNQYNNLGDKPFLFKVSSVSSGRMLNGWYTGDGAGNFTESTPRDYVECRHGIQYRFIATSKNVNGTYYPVWIMLQAGNTYFNEIGFDYITYLHMEDNRLKFHTNHGDYYVLMSTENPNN